MGIQSQDVSALVTTWKILMIDDDEEDFLIAKDMLKSAKGQKIDVNWAASYAAGQKELAAEAYDAVLIDYDLGLHSGIELIREANARGYTAPLILFTGRGSKEVDIEAMQAGAALYLTKSEANPLLLERCIRYAIERKQIEAALRSREETLRNNEAQLRASNEHLARELTERKQAEAALRLSDERFHKAFHASPYAQVISRTEDGRIEVVNESFLQLFGYSREEVLGKTSLEQNMYAQPADRQEAVRRLKEDHFLRDFDLDIRTRSGEIRQASLSVEMITIGGEPMMLTAIQDVTGRRQAEARLAYQAMLLQNIHDAVVATDTNQIITVWNLGAERLYGWSADEAIGRPVQEMIPTEWSREQAQQAQRELLETGEYTGSLIQYARDGRRMWVECRSMALTDATGKVTGLVSANRDITELKETQDALQAQSSGLRQTSEALRESETRYRTFYENLRESVVLFEVVRDKQGRLIDFLARDANPPALANLGLERDEALNKLASQVFPPEALERAVANIPRLLETGDTWTDEQMVNGRDYLYTVFRMNSNMIAVSSLDITEQKQAEAALRESQERLAEFLQNTHDSFFILDHEWRIQYINRRFAEINKISAEKLLGKVFWEAFPRYLGTPIEHYYRKVMAERTPAHFEASGMYSSAWYEVSVYPIKDGISVFAMDRTGKYQAEMALRESEEKYRTFFDQLHETVTILKTVRNEQGEITDWVYQDVNQTGLQLLGLPREQVVGKPVSQVLGAEVLNRIHAEYSRVLATGNPSSHDTTYQDRHFLVSVSRVDDDRVASIGLDDTERTLTHEERRKSEERYQRLFNSIDEGFCIIEVLLDETQKPVDYRFLEINPAFERQTGIQNAVGRRMREIAPLHEEYWFEIYGEIALTGVSRRFENQAAQFNHEYEVFAFRVGEPGERKVAILFNKINERKQMERSQRESEARLERAQQIAHLGSWELDLVHNRLTWSDEVYRIFGLQPQEFSATYEAFLEYVHPDDRAAVDAAYSGSLRENRDSYEIEHRVVRLSTGEIRFVHEKCQHIRDAEGKIIRSVGMVHDITERKQAEEGLRKSIEALRESEESFRQLADAMQQLVWTASPDGTMDYVNQHHQDYEGFILKEGLGWEWSQAIHPEDLPGVEATWNRSVQTGEIQQMEFRMRMADGTFRWHLARGVPIKDSEGHVTRWIGTSTDIEEQKQIEERLRRSNQELEEFAFVASHDLQEPLRKIKQFGSSIQQRLQGRLDADLQDSFDRMINASERMQAMIQGLLELSRVNTQGQPFAQVDLALVAAQVVSDLEPRILRTNGQVLVEELPSIEADPIQIHQVLQNLIANALKFHKPDVPPRVVVSGVLVRPPQQKHPLVSIRVQDNGIGFEGGQFERILQPFQRLHGRSEYEGNGMGLAIVKRIIERHHGEISAQSTPGVGSTFIITLPAKQTG